MYFKIFIYFPNNLGDFEDPLDLNIFKDSKNKDNSLFQKRCLNSGLGCDPNVNKQ